MIDTLFAVAVNDTTTQETHGFNGNLTFPCPLFNRQEKLGGIGIYLCATPPNSIQDKRERERERDRGAGERRHLPKESNHKRMVRSIVYSLVLLCVALFTYSFSLWLKGVWFQSILTGARFIVHGRHGVGQWQRQWPIVGLDASVSECTLVCKKEFESVQRQTPQASVDACDCV